jgi:hypothetical protein
MPSLQPRVTARRFDWPFSGRAGGRAHLQGEVHVAGGVNDVDAVVLPLAGGGGGCDGDAALLLLWGAADTAERAHTSAAGPVSALRSPARPCVQFRIMMGAQRLPKLKLLTCTIQSMVAVPSCTSPIL